MRDEELLRELGLTIQAAELLPDALLFDGEEGRFWFAEAVATDGEIHEARRSELLRWAGDHAIKRDQCGFVTGFLSRTHEAFRRRVSRLAWGTHAWFLDEPDRIVRLEDLPERQSESQSHRRHERPREGRRPCHSSLRIARAQQRDGVSHDARRMVRLMSHYVYLAKPCKSLGRHRCPAARALHEGRRVGSA